VSVFVDASYLGLLVAMIERAVISGVVLTKARLRSGRRCSGRPLSSRPAPLRGLCEHLGNEPMVMYTILLSRDLLYPC
jgi:hypothetical protein